NIDVLVALFGNQKFSVTAASDAEHVGVEVQNVFETVTVEVVHRHPGPAKPPDGSALVLLPDDLAGSAVQEVALSINTPHLDQKVHAFWVSEVTPLPIHESGHIPGRRRAGEVLKITEPEKSTILGRKGCQPCTICVATCTHHHRQ